MKEDAGGSREKADTRTSQWVGKHLTSIKSYLLPILKWVLFGSIFWYAISPVVWHEQHKVKKSIVDSLGVRNILEDEETGDIIDLMAGKITRESFYELCNKYWSRVKTEDQIKVEDLSNLWEADEALRNAMWDMQTRYWNPTIRFGTSSHTDSGRLTSFFISSDNAIHLPDFSKIMHWLKSWDRCWLEDDRESCSNFWSGIYVPCQTRLLHCRIAELSHAKQLHEWWEYEFVVRGKKDNERLMWESPDSLYCREWSYEYDAHTVKEPQLIMEFIHLYQKYAWGKSPQIDYKAAALLRSWQQDRVWMYYQDTLTPMIVRYLRSSSDGWYIFASYALWEVLRDVFNANSDPTIMMDGKSVSRSIICEEIKDAYLKAYNQWFVLAWYELLDFLEDKTSYHDFREKLAYTLSQAEGKMDYETREKIYQRMLIISSLQWDHKKVDEYICKMVDLEETP